jgi:FlaA1/EpsC-like NDP-sugar epimerase
MSVTFPALPVRIGFRTVGMARLVQRVIDFSALALAFWTAYLLRFDGAVPPQSQVQFMLLCPWVVALEYVLLRAFQMTRSSWRFVGLREARAVVFASIVATSVLLILRFAIPWFAADSSRAAYFAIPLGVTAGNMVLMCIAAVGVRLLRRVEYERRKKRARGRAPEQTTRTVLIGAGSAGHMLAREIMLRPDLGIQIVGFVDDDPVKKGMIIDQFEVYGTVNDLVDIVARIEATQALISISHVRGEEVRRITEACDACGLKAKIVPPINDLVDGQINVSQIRDVRIEDLLGREPVDMRNLESAAVVGEKVVMVTGAGGSIGSELCRQILSAGPSTLILVEQSEHGLYQIHRELEPLRGEAELVPAIADVCDAPRMRELFQAHSPEVVFHAAAHKHVPMMEANPCEAIKNNALGTRTVADLASEYGVEGFVFISTDKAVNPTSVMGATKRLAEIYLQALQRTSETRFVSVRFGNVLGSAGSVIPLFREQIAMGGPVTVTHAEMVRYFMTIPEACQLVLEAGAIGRRGELLVLDMGEPMKIVDLAEHMIRLSGFEPGRDIEIEFTGMRPGEKLFEELSFENEEMLLTRCAKIFLHKPEHGKARTPERIRAGIEAAIADPGNLRSHLRALVPSYEPLRVKPAASVGLPSSIVPLEPVRKSRLRRQAR